MSYVNVNLKIANIIWEKESAQHKNVNIFYFSW